MVKLPLRSQINNQTPPLLQTLENVIIATLVPPLVTRLLLVTHHPVQEPRPQGRVQHQLQQRQHDGVAVADVKTNLKTKQSAKIHLDLKSKHLLDD